MDKSFQNGVHRKKCGQFLGFSSEHLTQIGLIWNLQTGSITPQYHIAFDDLFTTVTNNSFNGTSQEQLIANWKEIIQTNSEQFWDVDEGDNENNMVLLPPLHAE